MESRWRITYWIASLMSNVRTPPGVRTLRTYGRVRAGCIWPLSWICFLAGSWVGRPSEQWREVLFWRPLGRALQLRRPPHGLVHHSDRGSQYASHDYQETLLAAGVTCSMSRKGNCWDNAPAESFFATLKKELIHQRHFRTRAEAKSAIFEFIESWYNRERLHSSLGYMSPVEFEAINNNGSLTHCP